MAKRKRRNLGVDPSENVKALSEAGNKTQNALRIAEARRQDDLRRETTRRLDTEIRCLKELGKLQAQHAKDAARSESGRLNAIRQVDVNNSSRDAAQSLTAIQTLASKAAVDADTLRNLVASTAQTMAKQTADTAQAMAKTIADTFEGQTKRLSALEQSSYEGKGKSTMADPLMAELLTEVRGLSADRNRGAGHQGAVVEQRDQGWKYIAAAIAFVGLLFAAATYLRPPSPPTVIVQPPSATAAK